ncbi:MAG: hypothetical protein JXN65_10260 [Clostridia bacterium]|nr:hypothetical protein [Clostridia bacterium]
MAKYKGYFDAVEGSPNYDSGEFSKVMEMQFMGVMPGYKNELEVTAGTGLQAVVDSGGMISKGRYFINDEPKDGASPETLSVDAATSGYLRKDRVVVEFDIVNAAAQIKVSKGTEAAADPQAPEIADGESLWEEPLAIINIEGGSIASIEDDRNIYGARTNSLSNPYCQAERGSSNQTSGTNIEYQAAPKDDSGMWDAANPDRLTAKEDGDYLLTYDICLTTTLVGHTQTSININGSGELLTRAYCDGSNALMKGAHVFSLSEGDYITIASPVILNSTNYVRALETYVTLKKIS